MQKFSNTLKYNFLAVFILMGSLSFGQIALADYAAENEGWLVSIDNAYAESQRTGKPILANFTGSDWCVWCKRLTKSVFIHDEFKTWAIENVILLELDFPKRKQLPKEIKQQNANLQRAFQVGGYPTIHLFDLEKNDNGEFAISSLGKTGYTKTVSEFIEGVEKMIARRKTE